MKGYRTPNGNCANPYNEKIQHIRFTDETVKINYADLTDAQLDYAVGLALGYKPNILDCKTGQNWIGYDIIDNPIQPFWRCVIGHREGRGKIPYTSHWFQPTQDSGDILNLMKEFRINVRSYDYYYVEATIEKLHGVKYVVNGSQYESICKVAVLAQLGEIVDIPIDLTKEISLKYEIVG